MSNAQLSKMARIDTPDVSDDDFAMVNSTTFDDTPTVSYQTPELISRLQRSQQPGPSRINSDDDAAVEQPSNHFLDGSIASLFNSQVKDSNLASYLGDVPGVKYTKSLYKKFSNKDVLIAVMG